MFLAYFFCCLHHTERAGDLDVKKRENGKKSDLRSVRRKDKREKRKEKSQKGVSVEKINQDRRRKKPTGG